MTIELATLLLALLGVVLAVAACVGVVGLAAWCRYDYLAKCEAGQVVERARQVMAPTQFPARPAEPPSSNSDFGLGPLLPQFRRKRR